MIELNILINSSTSLEIGFFATKGRNLTKALKTTGEGKIILKFLIFPEDIQKHFSSLKFHHLTRLQEF